ncbi:MAG TPA: serine/threonine protein kinase, partial [Thermoanaerobaculia bacterium]|nr:serine/threonine protein kinase [Thermoanaerobaculia bacterium]
MTARVSAAVLLVALLPVAYAVWSLFDVNRSAMDEQVLRTHAVAASTAADRIANLVETRQALARTLAANERIATDAAFLQEMLAADASIERIEVTNGDGEIVIRAQRRGADERLGTLPSSGPYLTTRNGAAFLLVTERLGETGTLRLVTDASPIGASLDPVEIGNEAEMVLASADARLLAGSAPIASFPKTMLDTARNARVNGTGVYPAASGGSVMGAFAPVSGTTWFVLSRQPAAVAQQIAVAMRRRAIVAAIVALALALLLAAAAHRTVVRPIRNVIAAQQRLAGAAVPSAPGTELEQLLTSTELLERRINDQEDLGRVFLGRYQVLGIIGQGGMGTVFRGWDPKLRRQVALKTVRFDNLAPEEQDASVESLVEEAVAAASMNHPNIVSIFDVEDAPHAAFIAMELIDGVSLQNFIDHRGKLSAGQTIVVGRGIARALAAAHGRGVRHYDVKPANTLLGFDGSIKVTDFGIAALVTTLAASHDMVFGTPGYIAPEAATGQRRDEKCDLFALGVVLYQCATGTHPFDRLFARETILASLSSTPPPLATVLEPSPLTGELSRIVEALMEKNPEARPAHAANVASAFDTLIEEHRLQWTIDPMEVPQLRVGHGSAALVQTMALEIPSR